MIEKGDIVKVKKIEIEMTQKEKTVANTILISGSCKGITCSECPLDASSFTPHVTCLRHVDPNILVINVTKTEIKLYEGMNVSNLTFRDWPEYEIISIHETKGPKFPIAALIRNIKNYDVRVVSFTREGLYSDKSLSVNDIISKEDK
jgi:hypothetical protein